jgi:hypothetical protein
VSATPTKSTPVRLGLTVDEAAASLGISRELFDEHVKPELRLVKLGTGAPGHRRIVVPIRELERWLERCAARYGEER